MVKINPHYEKISRPFIFPLIEAKMEALKKQGVSILNLGIGDVTRPLKPSIVQALLKAVEQMGAETIGYGPAIGHPFLREALAKKHGCEPDEIFVSEGIKADSSALQELFSRDAVLALADPTYPSYIDANVMEGRTGPAGPTGHYERVIYLPCTEESGFLPLPPEAGADLIYLCTPNNPTGTALNRTILKEWIDYARTHGSVLLIDAAYSAFIHSPDVPHSIYEIEGSDEVAIEMHSFSKSAGFSGLRCAYSIVPHALVRQGKKLNDLWRKRQQTKCNGLSYLSQVAALAALSPEGQKETGADVEHYMRQASLLRSGLLQRGETVYGGKDAPYLWWKAPEGVDLLERGGIMTIPGHAFGACGQGYTRLSAFVEEGVPELFFERLEREKLLLV